MKPINIELKNSTILVTGAAGFIGSNLVKRLLRDYPSATIVGVDNMNDYYDVGLKEERLAELQNMSAHRFIFKLASIADKEFINNLFEAYAFDVVVNLAAQAGVRYSITNPDAYIESNIFGFYNILEACRHSYDAGMDRGVRHLVYASSSSVYGANKKIPYSTDDKVDNPISLYAATIKSNELLAHAYSKLYDLPSTGLRFFTVYGPAGRPDMAYFGFTEKLVKGDTIKIFNYGNCKRDFTFVDDIVEGIVRIMRSAPQRQMGDDGLPLAPYSVYNIGNNQPVNLLDFVTTLQEELVRAQVLPRDYDFEAHKQLVPMQPGDVPVTYADTTALVRDFGFKPSTSIRQGLRKFAQWYKRYNERQRRLAFIAAARVAAKDNKLFAPSPIFPPATEQTELATIWKNKPGHQTASLKNIPFTGTHLANFSGKQGTGIPSPKTTLPNRPHPTPLYVRRTR